jgi:hypothetical protein
MYVSVYLFHTPPPPTPNTPRHHPGDTPHTHTHRVTIQNSASTAACARGSRPNSARALGTPGDSAPLYLWVCGCVCVVGGGGE